jgi:hypothetical protein
LIGCQRVDQLMTLVLAALAVAPWPRRAVRLVNDHEIRRGPEERTPVSLRFDEVDARDEVRVMLVDREVLARQLALAAGDARGAHDSSIDRELLTQLALPLIAQVRRAEHAQPSRDAAVEQLAGNHAGFDRLAHAHVIGNQQPNLVEAQRHDQRHELVGSGGDRDVPERAERRRARAQAESRRIEQEARGRRIGDRGRVGARKRCRLDLPLERQEEPDLLMVRPGERLQSYQVWRDGRQRHPITTARPNQ